MSSIAPGWLHQPLPLLAVLLACVALSEWLGRTRYGRMAGAAVIVIVLGALLANTGLIPSVADGSPVYGAVFEVALPLSIFYMLLDASLVEIRRSGGPLLGLFLLGSLGTVAGVLVALWLVPLGPLLHASAAPLAGMFAATYIGGGANFNAVAMEYGVVAQAAVFGGAVAVDNVMSALWVAITLVLPGLLRRSRRFAARPAPVAVAHPPVAAIDTGGQFGLATLLAIGAGMLLASRGLSSLLAGIGWRIPEVLVLTTLALLVAQTPMARRMRGAQPLGLFGIYLFLAVVGASADLAALAAIGRLALAMFAFVAVILVVHALVLFGIGAWLRRDPDMLAIASTANVGGSSTALALAEALGRPELAVGGVLVGSFGNALGTYVGFALAAWLA